MQNYIERNKQKILNKYYGNFSLYIYNNFLINVCELMNELKKLSL